MIKIFSVLQIIFLLIFFTNKSYSETKIVYLNMKQIMSESIAGKSIKKQLEKEHKDNLKAFSEYEKTLKSEEQSIVSQKAVLSKEEYQKKISNLRDKARKYQVDRRNRIDSLNKKRINATSQMLTSINPILAEYSDKNDISLIMQKKDIVIGKSDLDITKKIMSILDSKVKNIKLK